MSADQIRQRITLLGLDNRRGPLPHTVQRVLFGAVLFKDWPVELDCTAGTVTVVWDNDAGFSSIRTTISFERCAKQASMT